MNDFESTFGSPPAGNNPVGTPGNSKTSMPGNPSTSGVISGADGAVPQGAMPGGMTGSSFSGSGFSGSGDADSGSSSQADSGSGAVGAATDKAKAMAGQASAKLDTGMEKASATLDTGMDKAASGLGSLAETMRGKSDSLPGGEKVESIVTTAAAKIDSGAEMLRNKDTDQLMADLETMVRTKPVESLLVAAGIGFLFSKVLR